MGREYHISPEGITRHPWLNKPDTKYNDDGQFKTDLLISGEPANVLAAKIEAAAQTAFDIHVEKLTTAERKKWSRYVPFEREEDDEGNPTGVVAFKFKQNAVIKLRDGDTKNITIELRDSQDNVTSVPVFAGSKVRIMFSMRPIAMTSAKEAGVRLDFYKVQIIELPRRDRGFGAVDGGYVDDQDEEPDLKGGFGSPSTGGEEASDGEY